MTISVPKTKNSKGRWTCRCKISRTVSAILCVIIVTYFAKTWFLLLFVRLSKSVTSRFVLFCDEEAVVQANVWDEPIPSPRSNSPRNLPSSNVKSMRVGGAKSLHIPPAPKASTVPARNDPDDIFASLGFAAQPTINSTPSASNHKKNVPNAGSRWRGAVAAAPVSSSSTLSPPDVLDEADADAWGDDDGLDDL